jgi:glutamate racemase
VPLAEEGWTDGPIARQVAETYLASLARSGIDTLILGCTHYPLLKPLIAEVIGRGRRDRRLGGRNRSRRRGGAANARPCP